MREGEREGVREVTGVTEVTGVRARGAMGAEMMARLRGT